MEVVVKKDGSAATPEPENTPGVTVQPDITAAPKVTPEVSLSPSPAATGTPAPHRLLSQYFCLRKPILLTTSYCHMSLQL